MVVWPPPSPLPPEHQERYPSPLFSPSPPPPMAVPLPPSTPSPLPPMEPTPMVSSHAVPQMVPPMVSTPEPLPKKSNLKKRSQSENGIIRRFSNSSLHEIDQQIAMIQNEFEAELDTLIDVYRNSKQSKTSVDSSIVKNSERSRRGKHQTYSDDYEDGTYQALSVVFEDKSSG